MITRVVLALLLLQLAPGPAAAEPEPVAVVGPSELTVKSGQEFTVDASGSNDPEGQPLVYRWRRVRGSWTEPSFSTEPVFKGKAQNQPGDVEYCLFVQAQEECLAFRVGEVDGHAIGMGQSAQPPEGLSPVFRFEGSGSRSSVASRLIGNDGSGGWPAL